MTSNVMRLHIGWGLCSDPRCTQLHAAAVVEWRGRIYRACPCPNNEAFDEREFHTIKIDGDEFGDHWIMANEPMTEAEIAMLPPLPR
jgi:hypothetical protein